MQIFPFKKKQGQTDGLASLYSVASPTPTSLAEGEEGALLFGLARLQKKGTVFTILWFLDSR